jgi:hypothetical protein
VEEDFGRYLLTVEERDIDLLLMEEFHVSPAFVSWFAVQVRVGDATFAGAWHSVSDTDGETDLLLRVVSGGTRTAILIENKVAAPEQSRQDERYHIRGARSRDAGLFDVYITCMCAPSAYLAGLRANSLYERRIKFGADLCLSLHRLPENIPAQESRFDPATAQEPSRLSVLRHLRDVCSYQVLIECAIIPGLNVIPSAYLRIPIVIANGILV